MKKILLFLLVILLFGSSAFAAQSGGISTYLGDLQWLRLDGTNTPAANIGFGWYDLNNIGTVSGSSAAFAADVDITGYCTAGSVSDGTATLVGGDISGLGDVSATNLVLTGYATADSLSDGTAVIASGDISATNAVLTGYATAASVSDGTAVIESGDVSAVNLVLTGYATADSLSDGTVVIGSGSISGVGGLTATGNLDIGAYDLRAATLTADGLTSGRVVFSTTNGQLTDDADITFADDKLTVSTVKITTLECLPSADQTVANDAAIAPNASYVRVVGNGGAVVLDMDPAINDGDADGDILIIKGTNDTNTVEIADACNTRLASGQAFTLGLGDMIQLVWDSGDSLWDEVSRSNN